MMRIGILCEGPIDLELVSALLERIARSRARVNWPLQPGDVIEQVRMRKRGYGQIPKALKLLNPLLHEKPFEGYSLFVIVLDYKTRGTQRSIRRQIRGDHRFLLGIAIREIEAWWLADRRNTLEWLGLDDAPQDGYRYWQDDYNPERDDDPKRTLDELTQLSSRVDATYGGGNVGLAREFASLWTDRAELRQIETQCRQGFAPFCRRTTQAFHRVRKPHRNPRHYRK